MFTGLVEEIGTVVSVRGGGVYRRITVAAKTVVADTREGDSISIDGACQTVVALDPCGFTVEALAETLRKTTLSRLRTGHRVNLERAVTPSTRLGGHLVQGHVEGVATVSAVRRMGENVYLRLRLPSGLHRYCLAQGSIAVDGVSLTIADMNEHDVAINVIPTTWERTALADRAAGDGVNVETDVLARYVERLIQPQAATGGLTVAQLQKWGY